MKPMPFESSNRVLSAPSGMEDSCDPLHVLVEDGEIFSVWRPTASERAAIAIGADVVLSIASGSGTHPPVKLFTSPCPDGPELDEDQIKAIASIVHNANRAYCQTIGDHSQQPFHSAAPWQIASVIDGVRFKLANPSSTAEDSHENWCRLKRADGWVFGDVKDADAKTHPCLVPYGLLPLEQRRKDALFQAIVTALVSSSNTDA